MNASWFIPTTIAIIIAIPLATLVGFLIYEQAKLRANRPYKSLRDHAMLNAGSRDDWVAGVLPSEEVTQVSPLSTLYAPTIQLATVAVLAVLLFASNTSMEREVAQQRDQISELQTQVHALAFAGAGEAKPRIDPDPGAAMAQLQNGLAGTNPMQQACANLIGRVADAYEKGSSSKIAASLEALVTKLKCVGGTPQ